MPKNIAQEFMEKSKHHNLSPSPQRMGTPQPPLELPYPPEARRIELPKPSELGVPSIDLRAAIEKRRSLRRYAAEALSLEELSFLLWCTQGVKEVTERKITLRTVPSAGARHAFETLLLANRVAGLQPGVYRFAAIQHALLEYNLEPEMNEAITQACHNQDQVRASAATFIWIAVVERMTWRYVERGYRYLHLDAGHVCQNLSLAAEAIGCGVCAIAAFYDDEINRILGLDGENLFTVYVASLGKRPK